MWLFTVTTLFATKQDDKEDSAVFCNSSDGVGEHRAEIDSHGSGAVTSSGAKCLAFRRNRPTGIRPRFRFHHRHLEVAREAIAEAPHRIDVLGRRRGYRIRAQNLERARQS